MSNVARKFDLTSDLFSADDEVEDEPVTKKEDSSPEFQELVATMTERQDRRKKAPKTVGAATFEKSLVEVDAMLESRDWSRCQARHLVALYDRMHLKCYGIEAVELGPAARYNAGMMASGLVRREFDGDFQEAIDYMRWAWTKEIRKEKWLRENNKSGRRISSYLMFNGSLLTDYRLFLARRHFKA